MGDARSNCELAIQPVLRQIKKNKIDEIRWNMEHKVWVMKNKKWEEWKGLKTTIAGSVANTTDWEKQIHGLQKEWSEKRQETGCNGNCVKKFGNDWEFDRKRKNCSFSWDERDVCKYKVSYIEGKLEERKNSFKPQNPGSEPQRPTSVITSAATCCEQIFSDITVTGGGDNDINAVQNCSAKLSSGTGETNSDEDEFDDPDISSNDEEDDNTLWYLLFGGGTGGIISSSSCCCLLIIMIILLL
jgi:hypothetical protein